MYFIKTSLFLLFTLSCVFSQTLRIIQPETNDAIPREEIIEIIWKSSNYSGKVILEYKTEGIYWKTIDIVNAIEESYFWLPEEKLDGQVSIRISAKNKQYVNDVVVIGQIESEELKVTIDNYNPTPGEYLRISWNISTNVRIYYKPIGTNVRSFISSQDWSMPYFNWRIPESLENKRLEIWVIEDGNNQKSDYIYVDVQPEKKKGPALSVDVNTDKPVAGDYITISWNIANMVSVYYNYPGSARISLEKYNSRKSFKWKVPNHLAGKFIKIEVEEVGNVKNKGQTYITVKSKPTRGSLISTVNTKSPEPWGYLTIRWNISNQVKIYYTLYNRRTFIGLSDTGKKYYVWKVPNHLVGKQVKIEVEENGNYNNSDYNYVTVKDKISSTNEKFYNENEFLAAFCMLNGVGLYMLISEFGTEDGLLYFSAFWLLLLMCSGGEEIE